MQPNERYGLGWPGKQAAYDQIDTPPSGTLMPAPAGDRPHLFIEGDNLDALKLLPSGSVRLIYIDPPYNTGQAMRYRDRFRQDEADAGARRQDRWRPSRRGCVSAHHRREPSSWFRPCCRRCHPPVGTVSGQPAMAAVWR